jgi:UDP:flavonoid glycosyltransferase YjiC (YdhE family)
VLRDTGTPAFAVGKVSHDWLFAQLAAVVHHGGSGTTHRAVLAGVPSMAVPVGYDQPYWGRRLAELGVGVPPIAYRKLSPARLASAIGQLTGDPGTAARAPSATCSSKQIHARGAPSRWFGASPGTFRADCTHPIGTRP